MQRSPDAHAHIARPAGPCRMTASCRGARTSALVFDELDHQMACQAYLWSLPLVSYAQWKNQHHEVFGATSSDLVHYVSYRDRLGLITANATTPYILNFFDLNETGPLVVELPAGPDRGRPLGLLAARVRGHRRDGPRRRARRPHLVVPPGQEPPDGRRRLLRRPVHRDEHHVRVPHPRPRPSAARGAGRRRAHLPLRRPRGPPPTRIISPDGRPGPGDQPRGLDYWARLHEIYQREVVDERDRFYLAMLKQLGIEKGAPFAPDARLTDVLTRATAAGELMAQANTFAKRFDGSRYWPDRQWDLAIVLDNSAQRGEDYDELLERASWFYEAVSFSDAMKSQTPGAGQAYLGGYTDADGAWLEGGRDYTLHVPADPPAKLFWSATVYDVTTRCLIDNEQQRGDRGSRDRGPRHQRRRLGRPLLRPQPRRRGRPTGSRPSRAGTGSRTSGFYGPLEPYFDRSWKLGDITTRE